MTKFLGKISGQAETGARLAENLNARRSYDYKILTDSAEPNRFVGPAPETRIRALRMEEEVRALSATETPSVAAIIDAFRFGLVQIAGANKASLGQSAREIAILLNPERPTTLSLRLIKRDGIETLEVRQRGQEEAPVYLNVKQVITDAAGKPAVAVVSNSDLMNLVRTHDAGIRQELAQVSGVDATKPVHILTDLAIFGNLAQGDTPYLYFDIFVMQAWQESRTNVNMRNVSFALQGDASTTELAGARMAQLDKENRFNGALNMLFMTAKGVPEGAQVVKLVPPSSPISRTAGYRYLPVEKPELGDVVSYIGNMLLAVIGGRIDVSPDKSLDPHFKGAYERAAGAAIDDGTLKSIIQGLAAVDILKKFALKALTRVNLNAIYQWYKNMLSAARAA